MPFTTVPDKASGSTFTEANWDTHIRDNLNYMKEVAYGQMTSDLTVTATTAAAAQTVASAGAVTYEAVPHLIIVSCGRVEVGALGTATLLRPVGLDHATGPPGVVRQQRGSRLRSVVRMTIRLTPTAASHTYILKVWRENANGVVYAGVGAANDPVPCQHPHRQGAHQTMASRSSTGRMGRKTSRERHPLERRQLVRICQHWFGSPKASAAHAGCDDLLRSVQRSHQASSPTLPTTSVCARTGRCTSCAAGTGRRGERHHRSQPHAARHRVHGWCR